MAQSELNSRTNGQGKPEALAPDLDMAVGFLKRLHPGVPWETLTAITPDGTTTVRSLDNPASWCEFISAHNIDKGIYYSVNLTQTAMVKKAAKTDIAKITCFRADADPNDDETPEAAKSRYQTSVKQLPRPTVCTDSGNGLQFLWRLKVPLGPGYESRVEAINKAIMKVLGTKAGTQNIDRILRLPGTINHPNAAKRAKGRVACKATLVWFEEEHCYELEDFLSLEQSAPEDDGLHAHQGIEDDEDELERTIRNGTGKQPRESKSHEVWWVVNEMLRLGFITQTIVKTLLDRNNGISAHIYAAHPEKPERYARRQVENAKRDNLGRAPRAYSERRGDERAAGAGGAAGRARTARQAAARQAVDTRDGTL